MYIGRLFYEVNMKKTWWMSIILLLLGLGLVAAAVSEPLPVDSWDMPPAKGQKHEGLETNMRPEACAPCHQ